MKSSLKAPKYAACPATQWRQRVLDPGELLLVVLGAELPGAGPGVLLSPGAALSVPAVLLSPAMLKKLLRKKVKN